MTDYELHAEPGHYQVSGSPATLRAAFSVEGWQFFAFVFAAFTTLAFALLDELPRMSTALSVIRKVLVFVVLGYLTLFNLTVKDLLVRVLPAIKTKEPR